MRSQEFATTASVVQALAGEQPDLLFLDTAIDAIDPIEVLRRSGSQQFRGRVQLLGADARVLSEVKRFGQSCGLALLPAVEKPLRADTIRRVVRQQNLPNLKLERVLADKLQGAGAGPLTLSEFAAAGWLELWYQPKIDFRSRTFTGAEGLVRLRHPERGIVGPAELLAGASEASLTAVSEHVLLTALRDWPDFDAIGTPLRLAVNVPVSALLKLPIATMVRENRPKAAHWPGLILEITEDQVMRDTGLARDIALELLDVQVSLAIDDFGTGYSSLARLSELPFGELKLDRSFVAQCASNKAHAMICQTSIELAHRLGSLAVAEGIEDAATLRALHGMGCDLGQGYLFSPPVTKARLMTMLQPRPVAAHAS